MKTKPTTAPKPEDKPQPQPFRSEMTEAGQQFVIPGCERDDARTGARQMDLF